MSEFPRSYPRLGGQSQLAALAFALATILLLSIWADPALADVLGTLRQKGLQTFEDIRSILYVLAGFAIIGVATMAYTGRWPWSWLFSLIGALVLLAIAGFVVEYFGGANSGIENLLK